MTKSEIRILMKRIRDEMPIGLRNEYSTKIHERLYEIKEFRQNNMLFTFVSFGSEVNTISIIDKALQMNKDVYIPKVEAKGLEFYRILSIEGLIRSKFGILEPDSDKHQKYIPSQSDKGQILMLLPGLAFDKFGNRIGYGAGYYDCYLGRHSHKEWIKLALAYDFQIMEELTVDKNDIPADIIITPDLLINCNEYSG